MEALYYIQVDMIQPNPFQTRGHEDREHVLRLALLIAQQGLLQIPAGRPVKRGQVITMADAALAQKLGCQLAFGHSRAAAFRVLYEIQLIRKRSPDQQIVVQDDEIYQAVVAAAEKAMDTGASWSVMPVNLRDMSDEEMFAQACAENVHQDISVIDKAKAMLRWRTDFKKTSKEIGEIFGLGESAVRNAMRLVELPEQAQDALSSGALTQNAARRLLSVKDVLPPESMASLAKDLASGDYSKPESVDERIRSQVINDKRAKKLYNSYEQTKDLAGDGMWPLVWEPEVTARTLPGRAEVAQMLPDPSRAGELKNAILDSIRYHGPSFDGTDKNSLDAMQDPDVKAAVEHLLNPPACTKCSFYLRLSGSGYCARRACWEHKRELWFDAELKRVSAETGVKIYEPAVDGDVFEPVERWNRESKDRFTELLEKKDTDLRLRVNNSDGYWKWPITDHVFLQLVSVSAESRARMNEAKTNKERAEAQDKLEKENRERGWANQSLSREFYKAASEIYCARMFAFMSVGMLRVVSRALTRGLSDEEAERITEAELRSRLGYSLMNGLVDTDNEKLGPVHVAKYLQGVATEAGVTLPEDWIDIAQKIQDGAAVSTETHAEEDEPSEWDADEADEADEDDEDEE